MGLLAIRTHVDVCDDRLLAVEALLEVKKTVAPYLDLQLVAFPQDGFYRSPTAREQHHPRARHGRRRGRRHPAFRAHHGGGHALGAALCEIAAERGLLVDMHCDETDDPLSRHIETLASETLRLGLQGRVGRLAPHLDAFDGQLLRLEAAAADRRGRRRGHPQPADQHRDPGPPRHLSEAPRHDAGAGDAAAGHHGRLRPGLRARPLVSARHRRHARRRLHGPACGADDQPRRHARTASTW